MIAEALKRGLSCEVVNGEALPFENEFDAVFSNAALHWMKDYRSVINGVYKTLKPNGRFIGELGGKGNVATIIRAMQKVFNHHNTFGEFINPWFFPSPIDYQMALEKGGFQVRYIELINRPTHLSAGIQGWLKTFADGIIKGLDKNQKKIIFTRSRIFIEAKII